jgi:hypothetical protein
MAKPYHEMTDAERLADRIARRKTLEAQQGTEAVPTLDSPGLKAAATKGAIERSRASRMANWTRKYGKNDAENPHSKVNS